MNWLTIINTIVSYAWLGGSLWFLWRIMLILEKRNKSLAALAEAAFKSSESAHRSLQLVQDIVEILREKK